MIYIRWIILAVIDLTMIPIAYLIAPFVSVFTERGWPKWGSWFWTYDNPPHGDDGYRKKRAPFPNASTPIKLYVNRVFWLWRNPLYGFQKAASIGYGSGLVVKIVRFGGSGVLTSDKYERAGWYYAECVNGFGDIMAFEFYAVLPWSGSRCLRTRLGWKIVTDKFQRNGFAPLVDTFNPLDGYGNN